MVRFSNSNQLVVTQSVQKSVVVATFENGSVKILLFSLRWQKSIRMRIGFVILFRLGTSHINQMEKGYLPESNFPTQFLKGRVDRDFEELLHVKTEGTRITFVNESQHRWPVSGEMC